MVENLKAIAINIVKKWCSEEILASAPYYRQINAALGIYNDTTKSEIVSLINSARSASDAREALISACQSESELHTCWAGIIQESGKLEAQNALGPSGEIV